EQGPSSSKVTLWCSTRRCIPLEAIRVYLEDGRDSGSSILCIETNCLSCEATNPEGMMEYDDEERLIDKTFLGASSSAVFLNSDVESFSNKGDDGNDAGRGLKTSFSLISTFRVLLGAGVVIV